MLNAVLHCYASLYTERAIKYRFDKGFKHAGIALSVGIQRMVRSDSGCSGVCFTLEPESGFRDVIHIAGSWGLGENVVDLKSTFYCVGFKIVSYRKICCSKKIGYRCQTFLEVVKKYSNPLYIKR